MFGQKGERRKDKQPDHQAIRTHRKSGSLFQVLLTEIFYSLLFILVFTWTYTRLQ